MSEVSVGVSEFLSRLNKVLYTYSTRGAPHFTPASTMSRYATCAPFRDFIYCLLASMYPKNPSEVSSRFSRDEGKYF
ncbi:hypothetical protein E2C01_095920 [Portunus trituberculatus]|uniref:Uncharacterized protein n=1 Tax=Portunus trituberculatus TaxID=210409 RepID=A0A5B7K1N7_PORTR|nr:hypothetical protein [Portunus trituberculatus]